MYKYPINFICDANSKMGINSEWTVTSVDSSAKCSIPKEFNGPGGAFSPEDLFAQALSNCLLATFKVFAEHSKLTFDEIKVSSVLVVDQNESKKVVMKRCDLTVNLKNPSSKDKAELLIKKAFDTGFILNSVKTDLSYTLNFE